MNLSKLDLKIELSQSQSSKISGWLDSFYCNCKSRMSDPIVEANFLKISSADIYNFLAAVEASQENIFDYARLKRSATRQMIVISSRKKEALLISHYTSIVALLQGSSGSQA